MRPSPSPPPLPPTRTYRRIYALGGLVLFIAGTAIFAGPALSTLEARVIEQAPALAAWVQNNALLYAGLFLTTYLAITAFALPLSALLSLGGSAVAALAFGFWAGTCLSIALVWTSVVLGSWALFEGVQRFGTLSLGPKAAPYLEKFQTGFERDQFLYMLSSRFTPIPPAVSTILPAVLGARRSTFLLATSLGFLPGVAIYASLGAKLGELLSQHSGGASLSFSTVVNFSTTWPLLAFLALSLAPLAIRRLRP